MEIEKISEEEIVKFEIPTGELIVYEFDKVMQMTVCTFYSTFWND